MNYGHLLVFALGTIVGAIAAISALLTMPTETKKGKK